MTGSDAVHMGNDVAGMLKQKEPDRQEIKQRKKIENTFLTLTVCRFTHLLFDLQ